MFENGSNLKVNKFFVLVVIFFLFSSVVFAGECSKEGVEDDIEALKQQIRELQRKIEVLESKQRKAVQRSEQVQAAEGPLKKWYNDAIVKIKKGKRGLTWESASGNYKLRMRLRGQFLAQLKNSDDDTSLGFRIRRARINWDGHAFAPWFKYKIQIDFSSGVELKDLMFDFAYDKRFVPRVGQYKVAFNREELTSSSSLQLVERSEVNEEFSFGRDIGIGLWGVVNKIMRYELGFFQGEGNNVKNDKNDANLLWAGRIQFSPLGSDLEETPNFAERTSLALGLGIAGVKVKTDGAGGIEDLNLGGADERIEELGAGKVHVVSWTADISFKHSIFNLEGEYIGRWVDPDEGSSLYDQGVRVQGGIFVIPKTLEVAGRFAYIAFDDEVGDVDNLWSITPGVNYYMSKDHRWKVQIDYSFIRKEGVDGVQEDTNRLRAQLQAYF